MLRKSLDEFIKNPFKEFNNVWPILVAGDRKGFNGMTISWGGIGVLWNKNVAFVFVRKSRFTHEFCDKTDQMSLSFLSNEYLEAKKLFGSKTGRDINKFEVSGLHPCLDVDFNGYFVAEAEYALKLKKLYSIDMPYEKLPENIKNSFYANGDEHTMYVCEITQYLVNEE